MRLLSIASPGLHLAQSNHDYVFLLLWRGKVAFFRDSREIILGIPELRNLRGMLKCLANYSRHANLNPDGKEFHRLVPYDNPGTGGQEAGIGSCGVWQSNASMLCFMPSAVSFVRKGLPLERSVVSLQPWLRFPCVCHHQSCERREIRHSVFECLKNRVRRRNRKNQCFILSKEGSIHSGGFKEDWVWSEVIGKRGKNEKWMKYECC